MFPRTKSRRAGLGFLAIVALMFLSQPMRADFIPPYGVPTRGYLLNTSPQSFQVGTWTLTTSGTDTSTYANAYLNASPTEVSFDTGVTIEQGFQAELSIALTNTIAATGMLSFDYSLTLRQTAYLPGANYGAYTLDGTVFKLQPGTGSIDIPVVAGENFGFLVYATSNCITCVPAFAGQSSLTITHFNAPVPNPVPVPEPATMTLLLCGVGLALVRRRIRLRGSERAASL